MLWRRGVDESIMEIDYLDSLKLKIVQGRHLGLLDHRHRVQYFTFTMKSTVRGFGLALSAGLY